MCARLRKSGGKKSKSKEPVLLVVWLTASWPLDFPQSEGATASDVRAILAGLADDLINVAVFHVMPTPGEREWQPPGFPCECYEKALGVVQGSSHIFFVNAS